MQLEGFIDPFDLDVFKPHLSRNLDRHHQRCSVSQLWLEPVIVNPVQVMLGSISSLSSSSHLKLKGSSSVIGVTQEKHNVMPVAPTVAVFSSLPVITPSLSHETPLQVNRPTASVIMKCAFYCRLCRRHFPSMNK